MESSGRKLLRIRDTISVDGANYRIRKIIKKISQEGQSAQIHGYGRSAASTEDAWPTILIGDDVTVEVGLGKQLDLIVTFVEILFDCEGAAPELEEQFIRGVEVFAFTNIVLFAKDPMMVMREESERVEFLERNNIYREYMRRAGKFLDEEP